jgi:hypothetical protein
MFANIKSPESAFNLAHKPGGNMKGMNLRSLWIVLRPSMERATESDVLPVLLNPTPNTCREPSVGCAIKHNPNIKKVE